MPCPRCGFSQPKDKYCAQCGVDMEAFRPKAAPLSKRILTNPLFFMALVFVVVFSSILVFRKQQPSGFFGKLAGGPRTFSERESSRSAASVEGTQNLYAANTIATNSAVSDAPETSQAPKVSNVELTVSYVEIERNAFDRLKVESQNAGLYGDLGDLRTGIVPEVQKKMSEKRGIKVLETVKKTLTPQQLGQQWFVGRNAADGEPELGFATVIALESLEGPNLRGEIELIRIGRDGTATPPTRHPYPVTSFEVAPGFGWIINASVPALNPEEQALELPSALQIYKSPRFTKTTDFALLIEFHRSTEE